MSDQKEEKKSEKLTGTVSAEKFKELYAQYKKLQETNEVLLDFNMQINDLMAVYSNGKDGADIVETLKKMLIEYDDMKTELAINGDSFTGGRIAVKDIEIPKDEE